MPDQLFRIPLAQAFAQFQAPLHLEWSKSDRAVDLSDRRQRLRWYEIVLREGSSKDIRTFVDGALLVDAWRDLVLPQVVRAAWQSLVEAYFGGRDE